MKAYLIYRVESFFYAAARRLYVTTVFAASLEEALQAAGVTSLDHEALLA